MCTAITYQTKDTYLGRTLDLECSYDESVIITPRHFPFHFRHEPSFFEHHALIGMATVMEGYPLYYDAVNEKGLAMAGLHFPQTTCYSPTYSHTQNIASFELIPWVLSQCDNVAQACALLKRSHLCDTAFRKDVPPSPLHWILADRQQAVTAEHTQDGWRLFDNPVGVLTNEPSFDYHLMHLNDFMGLSAAPPDNRWPKIDLNAYSRGMGSIGLPGDVSSASRFIRAAFMKLHSIADESERDSVNQCFHILDTVSQPRGCNRLANGQSVVTVYSSCINLRRGTYYVTTYDDRSIRAVEMHDADLDDESLIMTRHIHT